MTSVKWTEALMQNALCDRGCLFDYALYACVPNVSWAILDHGEADLLCLSKSGVFHEVEIKVSRSDLRADKKKHLAHQNRLVAYTWFAVPTELELLATQELDERFGIVVVAASGMRNTTRVVRRPKRFRGPGARRPEWREIERFLRGGVMRMWVRRTGYSA